MIRHAGLIAVRTGGEGAWRGVLIEGPSGSGKSDLALRAFDAGFRLVADDRVLLWTSGGRLFGRAPDTLRDLIEVRGVEIARLTALPLSEVALVARCGEPERLPEPRFTDILGVRLPLIVLDPREASAPAKLGRALAAFDAAHKRRI
jgi:serine kinase of HPr protein (carbohydrate metabolism regulator)